MKTTKSFNWFASIFLFLFCITLLCSNLFCEGKKVSILIDHKTMKAQIEINRDLKSKYYETNSEIFLPPGEITIKVTHTNSALYDYTLVKKEVDSKDLLAWQTFMTDFVPFMISESPTLIKSDITPLTLERSPIDRINEIIDKLVKSLNKVNEILYNKDGIQDIYFKCIHLFNQHHNNSGELAKQAKKQLKSKTNFDQDYRLINIKELISQLNTLNELILKYNEVKKDIESLQKEFETNISKIKEVEKKKELSDMEKKELMNTEKNSKSLSNKLPELIKKATKLLDSSEKILGFAYKTENLAKIALKANNSVVVGTIKLNYKKGKEITLSIKPKTDPLLTRYESLPPSEIKLTLQAQIYVRPSVGLAAMYANDAAFSTFEAKEIEGGFQIIEKPSSQNSHLNLGLTLGITIKPLDGRLIKGLTFWFPEITISPSTEVKYVGLGMAVSIRSFKFGIGVLWIKHVKLGNGQNINDVLGDPADLVVTNTYEHPKIYFSLSIIDWPPFKK